MAERDTSHDMERNQLIEGHLQTGDGRGRDKSVYKRKQPRKGHSLPETAEGGTSQDMETKQLGKRHSLSGDGRGRDKSGYKMKATE